MALRRVFLRSPSNGQTPARIYQGRDAEGKPIDRAKGLRANDTINRYRDERLDEVKKRRWARNIFAVDSSIPRPRWK